MRNPNSANFKKWQELHATGQMVGLDRPVGRVSIGTNVVRAISSDRPGPWRHLQFQDGHDVELPFVKSIEWDRSLQNDSATCTIVVDNNLPALDKEPEGVDVGIGNPGALTFNRGAKSPVVQPSVYNLFIGTSPSVATSFHTSWGYSKSQWFDKLIPNRLIRTYEGYGSDNMDMLGYQRSPSDPDYVSPHDDSKLVVTGTWLIDSVHISSGLITIHCRDLGKLLLEQVVYPPMIPLQRFPLTYCPETAASGTHGGTTISQNRITYDSAALELHQDRFSGGYIFGHHGRDAFDGRPDTFFLSHSYPWDTDTEWAREWLQGNCHGNKINEITIRPLRPGLIVFISIQENGAWQGSNTISYSWHNHSHHSDIPYVLKTTLGSETNTIKLPRTYDAGLVRFTFTHLQDYGPQFAYNPNAPWTYPYRAAIREVTAKYIERVPDTFVASTVGVPGHIHDWSDAVKELAAWAGFTWRTGHNYADGSTSTATHPKDPLIGTGSGGEPLAVWGNVEFLGAGPIECSPNDFFLNKSFQEAIKTVADFIGALFFVDEYGGVQFRMPNLFSGGNQITDVDSGDRDIAYKHRQWPIELHEDANLLDYSVTIDDSQVRSEILVVGSNPDTNSSMPISAGVVLGTNPITGESSAVNFSNVLAGQYRLFLVPGDQTKNFKTVEECQRMAELTGVKILFSYRKGTAKIPGHPGLQLDDQVRIFERVSNEYNVHYVSAIKSSLDNESGAWTYDVETHWLGDDPDTDWFLNYVQLTPAVKRLPAVLKRVGDANNNPGGPGGQSSGGLT